jgi:hypothetical protein
LGGKDGYEAKARKLNKLAIRPECHVQTMELRWALSPDNACKDKGARKRLQQDLATIFNHSPLSNGVSL